MNVQIVDFPETKVAAVEHRGPPELEYQSARKLVEWRILNRLPPDRHRSYGIHYTDPLTVTPADHRVDFCVTVDFDIPANAHGVIGKIIPAGRCAVARHLGSRNHISVVDFLYKQWLAESGQTLRDFPVFFHYVNVGPSVQEHEMITDVYLPLR